jgi:7-carboxy-7-deazaguanine synthase
MRISEIFYSLQGEGSLTGVPSLFIRTSGCNLRCTWCDTPYTSWEPEGADRTVADIADEAERSGARHVVITGGEPMIAREIVDLTLMLASRGRHITIETAGTVIAPVACDLMSISPKLANSTPHLRGGGQWAERHDRVRYAPRVLRRLITEYPHQLKFVVMSPEDLAEIRSIVEEIRADRANVLLMPEGRDDTTLRDRSQWLAEICKREGYRFSPRLHIQIWGDQRGV